MKTALGFGRSTKLTEDVIFDFCIALIDGRPWDRASVEAGLSRRTTYRWKNVGEALMAGEDHNDAPRQPIRDPNESDEEYQARYDTWYRQCELLVRFYLESERARDNYLHKMENHLTIMAEKRNEKFWYLPMTVLERRDPTNYGQTKRVESDIRVTHSSDVSAVDEYRRALADLTTLMEGAVRTIEAEKAIEVTASHVHTGVIEAGEDETVIEFDGVEGANE